MMVPFMQGEKSLIWVVVLATIFRKKSWEKGSEFADLTWVSQTRQWPDPSKINILATICPMYNQLLVMSIEYFLDWLVLYGEIFE
jgi:hypothetical protein